MSVTNFNINPATPGMNPVRFARTRAVLRTAGNAIVDVVSGLKSLLVSTLVSGFGSLAALTIVLSALGSSGCNLWNLGYFSNQKPDSALVDAGLDGEAGIPEAGIDAGDGAVDAADGNIDAGDAQADADAGPTCTDQFTETVNDFSTGNGTSIDHFSSGYQYIQNARDWTFCWHATDGLAPDDPGVTPQWTLGDPSGVGVYWFAVDQGESSMFMDSAATDDYYRWYIDNLPGLSNAGWAGQIRARGISHESANGGETSFELVDGSRGVSIGIGPNGIYENVSLESNTTIDAITTPVTVRVEGFGDNYWVYSDESEIIDGAGLMTTNLPLCTVHVGDNYGPDDGSFSVQHFCVYTDGDQVPVQSPATYERTINVGAASWSDGVVTYDADIPTGASLDVYTRTDQDQNWTLVGPNGEIYSNPGQFLEVRFVLNTPGPDVIVLREFTVNVCRD